jgi:succinate dehydrogenase / fumarate reductase flavoprotein subunit
MYHEITGDDPYETPMMIYPAPHYTMGGLWVDYNLMTTVEGLFALGECNFSDHGANRLGASALMQGLADGYFVIPYTLGNYLASVKPAPVSTDAPEFAQVKAEVAAGIDALVKVKGKTTADEIHRRLGDIMIDKVGMSRSEEGLKTALEEIPKIRELFHKDLCVPGDTEDYNKELEKAGRVADFLELGELMARDALERRESCGGHFRVEMQDEEGEARRDDENFCHAAVWKYRGEKKVPERLIEPLTYEYVIPSNRSYK